VTPERFQLINQADFVLSKCGRFQPPKGSVVYIPKSFLVQAAIPTSSGQTYYKEITGDTTWCLRSISVVLSGNPPAVSAQVLAPNGKFLFNGVPDLITWAGFGSLRYGFSREIECVPGSKVQVTIDDNYLGAAATQPVSILFGGAYAYYLKDGRRSECPEDTASDMPRIWGSPNQNPFAPWWMQGHGLRVPHGFRDDPFSYGNGISNVATATIGASGSPRASIQTDNDSDFLCRRFLFDVIPGPSVTAGTFLVRIRSGSGYTLTDDYLDVAKYIGGAYFVKPWTIRRADQIFFDMIFVDGAGSGSISIECFADGVKRKRA